MFEKIIEQTLNRVLGEYVEGIDRNQLKLGLWSGDLEINGLKLKPDIF